MYKHNRLFTGLSMIGLLLVFSLVLAACVAPQAPSGAAPAATEPAEEATEAEAAEAEATEAPAEEAAGAMHPALEDNKLTIAWIPKALNNPVFEIGRVGAETKAAELTEQGPYEVEIVY